MSSVTSHVLSKRSQRLTFARQLLILLAVIAVVASAAPAQAATAGYRRDSWAGPIFARYVYIPANTPATFETTNLRANGMTTDVPDTVMHVFQSGVQIAANDDCGGELRSCVTLGASTADRGVYVYVRGYSNRRFGLANFRTIVGGSATDEDFYFAGNIVEPGPLASGAWVETVEQNHLYIAPTWTASSDTLVFVLSGATNVVGFSDDEGIGNMSKLRTTAACASDCQIVVGDWSGSGWASMTANGYTTLAWSDDTNDSDADGLPNTFEALADVALSPVNQDTDNDGITDGAEVLGVDLGDSLLRYPYFGADPKLPDLFLEIDYYSGGAAWTSADAEEFARAYRVNGFKLNNGGLVSFDDLKAPPFSDARDVRVHLDIGVENTATNETRFVWGNWGGSNWVAATDWCTGLTATRTTWHHLLSRIPGVGGTSNFGRCGLAGPGLYSGVHELGHQLGLNHGGSPNEGPNGSMVYASVMNYQFAHVGDDPAFSVKRWTSPLNVSWVNETTWAPTGTNMVAYLPDHFTASRYVNGANWIDLNSDNIFESGSVRGAATVGRDTATGGQYHWNSGGLNNDVELAWLPGATASGNKLYFFHMYEKNGATRIDYRIGTSVGLCDNKQPSFGTPCQAFGTSSTVAGTDGVQRFFGVERLKFGTNWKLFIAFVNASGQLRNAIMSSTGSPTVTDVPAGAGAVTGPAVVRLSDTRLLLLAGVGSAGNSQLYAWEYDTAMAKWTTQGVAQTYDTGAAMMVSTSGISLTQGYMADTGSTIQIIGALADGNLIKMVRYDSTNKKWKLLNTLNASANGGNGFWSNNKIAVAYVPYYSNQSITSGRYFLAYNRPGVQGPDEFMARTFGNDPNAVPDATTGLEPKALKWRLGGQEEYINFEWEGTTPNAGVELMYDLTYDTHLRGGRVSAAWDDGSGTPINSITFLPFADGTMNVDLVDYDDWKVMRANLPCSLGQCPRQ